VAQSRYSPRMASGERADWSNRVTSVVAAWWHRSGWRTTAAVAVPLAVSFGVVAAIQRIELQNRHLHVNWGTVPEWLAGVGTFAAFGALLFAAREWRAAQVERRDREASQARLIIVEPAAGAASDKVQSAFLRHEIDAVIKNHSHAPIFNLAIASCDDTMVSLDLAEIPAGVPRMIAIQEGLRRRVVPPHGTSVTFKVKRHGVQIGPSLEWVTFGFTDAHGTAWRRRGSDQPQRLIGEPSHRV
jgi:hypothetical protein